MKNMTKEQLAAALKRFKHGGFRHPRNKSLPDASTIHVSGLLTNVAINWTQNPANVDRYASESVIPKLPVAKSFDQIFRWSAADINRDEAEVRGSRAGIPLINLRTDTVSYNCKVHVVGGVVTEQDEANQDAVVDKAKVTTAAVMRKLYIRRERRFVTNFMTTGKWTNEMTGSATPSGATQFAFFDDEVNSDPVGLFQSKIDQLLLLVDDPMGITLTIPQTVWTVLSRHDQVLALMPGGAGGVEISKVTQQRFAELLGIGKVKVVRGAYTTSAKGAATDTFSYAYSDACLLTYAPSSPSTEEPSAFYNPRWTGLLGSNDTGIRVRRFWDDHESAWIIVGEMADDMIITSQALGYAFINCLST